VKDEVGEELTINSSVLSPKKRRSLGSQRMRFEFYPTDSLEIFREKDSMTKKDLWNKCTATAQKSCLIIRQKQFLTL